MESESSLPCFSAKRSDAFFEFRCLLGNQIISHNFHKHHSQKPITPHHARGSSHLFCSFRINLKTSSFVLKSEIMTSIIKAITIILFCTASFEQVQAFSLNMITSSSQKAKATSSTRLSYARSDDEESTNTITLDPFKVMTNPSHRSIEKTKEEDPVSTIAFLNDHTRRYKKRRRQPVFLSVLDRERQAWNKAANKSRALANALKVTTTRSRRTIKKTDEEEQDVLPIAFLNDHTRRYKKRRRQPRFMSVLDRERRAWDKAASKSRALAKFQEGQLAAERAILSVFEDHNIEDNCMLAP
jgi:hypothetical protein